MNQVNITGMIVNEPIFRMEARDIPHTTLNLRVQHKTRLGEVRKETYRVSAWRGVAKWAREHVAVGQIVTIHGYLTQRKTRDSAIVTEICADEIVPSVQTAYKSGYNVVSGDGGPAQTALCVAAAIAPVTNSPAANMADSLESVPGDTSAMPASLGNGDASAA